ncbi:5-oxoprolinase subunit B family protein [Nocardioides daejeonensis]|uniref:5-oxoprolinase subunit B family protein n=1 Tax=Nocardioides daejeonensis TaxID=1046556 RepID=UPI000D74A5FB|nr:allophanate hydrolase subunit 1 [Nocardioides daejeonensis]
MRCLSMGPKALLVETDGPWRSLALAELARAEDWAVDVVPAAATVLLDGVRDPEEVRRRVVSEPVAATPPDGPTVRIPVTYDGPDLEEVATRWQVDSEQVVARHTSVTWVALFTGFAPGFGYLATKETWPSVGRRSTPRPRVPAGAVGLADRWSGIYPAETPGGWQLIGRTEVVLWDALRADPALLTPGTRVRFVAR